MAFHSSDIQKKRACSVYFSRYAACFRLKVGWNQGRRQQQLPQKSPAGVTFTQENCEYLMGEYFALCKEAGTILADIVPSFDSTTGYHEADHWQKYLDLDDLNQVFNLSYLKPSFGDQATFFKS